MAAAVPMVDIHSHILPGVDDGVKNVVDALAMLRLAVKDGVMSQVLTPHIHIGRFDNAKHDLQKRFEAFQHIVEHAKIPIDLHLSAEIRLCPEIVQMVEKDKIPWLGHWNGDRTFLMEFPERHIPAGSINLIKWLRQNNTLPVIVHPERNNNIQSKPERLDPFLEEGCLVQITASSLTGNFGRKAKKTAIKLLKQDKVFVIASDSHNLSYRPPNLSQGVAEAAKVVGKRKANDMVSTNAIKLLIGERDLSKRSVNTQ